MPVHVDPSITKLAEFLTATQPLSPYTTLHTEPNVLAPPLCIGDLRAALALRTDAEGVQPIDALTEEELHSINPGVVVGQVGNRVVTAKALLMALRSSITRRGLLAMALEECLELSWEADGPEDDEEANHPMTRLEVVALQALGRAGDDDGTPLAEVIDHMRSRRVGSVREWRRRVAKALGWKPEEEGDELTPKLAGESIAAVVEAAGHAADLNQRLTTMQANLEQSKEDVVREGGKFLRADAALQKLGLPDLSAPNFDAKLGEVTGVLKSGWLAQKNLASTAAREAQVIAALDEAGVPRGVSTAGDSRDLSYFQDDRVRWLARRGHELAATLGPVSEAALLLGEVLHPVATAERAGDYYRAGKVRLTWVYPAPPPEGGEHRVMLDLPDDWLARALTGWKDGQALMRGDMPLPLPLRPVAHGEVTEKVPCRVCRRRSVFSTLSTARLVLGLADTLHEGMKVDVTGATGWRFKVAFFEAQLRLLSAHFAYALAGVCSSCVEKVDPALTATHDNPPELHGAALARWRRVAPHDFKPGTMFSMEAVREAIIDTAQATTVDDRKSGAVEVGERLGMKVAVPPLESEAPACGCPPALVEDGQHLPTCPALVEEAARAENNAKLDELREALVAAGRVVSLRTVEGWTVDERAQAGLWAQSRQKAAAAGGTDVTPLPVPEHVAKLRTHGGSAVCLRSRPVEKKDAENSFHPDADSEDTPSGDCESHVCPWCKHYWVTELPQ